MPGDAYLVIEDVSKHFDSVVAVRDVGIQPQAGEFFSPLDPAGCGKTRLAGFETPTRGRVCIYGVDVSGVPGHQGPTDTVFLSHASVPHLSVGANVNPWGAFGRTTLP